MALKQWRTDTGEGSRYFDTSVAGLAERVRLWLRANDLPEDGAKAAFDVICGPGGGLEIAEGHIALDAGSTSAPHLGGPEGKGQKYRYFKNGPQTLREWYSTLCQAHAEKPFIVYKGPDAAGGDERYTFAQALSAAGGLAAYLMEDLRVRQGDRISMNSRNNPEWVLSFMAATSVGCVAVPTNSLWISAELEYGMNDAGCVVAFVDGERAARLLPLCREGKLPKLKAVIVSRDPQNVAAQGGGAVKVISLDDVMSAAKGRPMPSVEVSPESNVTIMYTSGTTGHPKGVVSTNRSLVSALRCATVYGACGAVVQARSVQHTQQSKPELATGDAVLCPVPLFHATGTHAVFLLSFMVGRKLVLMHKWDPLEALKLIDSEKVSTFIGVPTMSMEVLTHPDYAKYDTSSLTSLGGGGAAPPKKLSALTAKAGKGAGQGWGLTESNAITVGTFSSKEYVANPSSCGRAHVLIDIKIVDEDNKELKPGEVGEVLIRGVPMLKEYWNRPEATSEALSIDGWFRTGDVGKLDPDGSLYILDRAKDLIIRGGENISCAEVETAVYEHPAVQECAVFGWPDERLGESVAVAVVRRPTSPTFTGEELSQFCTERLAKFKVPTEIFLWKEGEQLPRGATGKIPKRTIKDDIIKGTAGCTKILGAPAAKL